MRRPNRKQVAKTIRAKFICQLGNFGRQKGLFKKGDKIKVWNEVKSDELTENQ